MRLNIMLHCNKPCGLIGCLILLIYPLFSYAQTDPGIDFDLQGYIDNAIYNGETHIVIPPGRYRVAPQNRIHLRLHHLNNITLEATGVEMICTQTTRALSIYDCHNLHIIGLTIDYDPLPFTQGRIIGLSEDKLSLTVELMEGYPEATFLNGTKAEIYAAGTDELVTTTYYNIELLPDGPKRVVISKPSYYSTVSQEARGDIVVLSSNSGSTIPHAIVAEQSTALIFETMTLYAANTFGFYETECSGSRYEQCKVDRRLLANDLKTREYRRLRSLNADAFHSKKAAQGPAYIGCIARYMGDDGIAINGDYHIITASHSATSAATTTLRVLPKLGNPLNLAVGDSAELITYSGQRLADATITAIELANTGLTAAEIQFLADQSFNSRITQDILAAELAYTVTIEGQVDMPLGSLIASSNRLGNGFIIQDCTIGPNRSRGILVKASHGSIINNHLVDNWIKGIKVAPEYYWLEAGSSNDIIIAGNTITGSRDAAIAVYAEGGDGNTAPAGAHHGIQITANHISHSTNPAIAVTSTAGLTLFQNVIEHPNNELLSDWIYNQFGRNEDASRRIYLENVIGLVDSPAGPLEAWRGRYGLAIDGSDDSDVLSSDGLPAMASLAFNLGDPRTFGSRNLDLNDPSKGGLPLITQQPKLAFHFIRHTDNTSGLVYTCQLNPTLVDSGWEPIESSPEAYHNITTSPILDTNYELVSVMLNESNFEQGFLRVSVERD